MSLLPSGLYNGAANFLSQAGNFGYAVVTNPTTYKALGEAATAISFFSAAGATGTGTGLAATTTGPAALAIVPEGAALTASLAIAGGAAARAAGYDFIKVFNEAREPERLQRGKEFEDRGVQGSQDLFDDGNVARRLSVRAFDEEGNLLPGRTVLDAAGFVNGEFTALEFKLSELAPLTTRQAQLFGPLARNGGIVVGRNGRDIGLFAQDTLMPFNVIRINGPRLPTFTNGLGGLK